MPGHIARRRFGQHFLVDAHYIGRIIDAISPSADDRMVEIGPGLGAITKPLLEKLNHLHVVEIDRDIVARLDTAYAKDKLTIHAGDALKFNFGGLGERLRVVGNLPYNISSPLLFHLAQYAERIVDMTFMLQKEVVDRMVAAPSSSDYGRLSVMLQCRFAMRRLFIVPPGAFQPPPKVDSALVRMLPLPAEAERPTDPQRFAQVVAAAFSQRRKVIRNTLKPWLAAADFAALQIDPQLRAENLSLQQFIRIADYTLR
ncbi:MAG: 16S rRNA (adenine(1518)-N(6)/adenine(1519)-N(6))-dimethyltransferase RsmA [Burkholderiales bacterium]|nr:16S rRNA (adenine(1518)-N(6)/adenine(1519)-N(6))-dimethyltransferase RsmA [Burkholderiales bacterium]